MHFAQECMRGEYRFMIILMINQKLLDRDSQEMLKIFQQIDC